MYKIMAVCNAGVGTSAFAKGLIETAIKELGYNVKDFKVECTELAGSGALKVDLIVTVETLKDRIKPSFGDPIPIVPVKSLVSGTEEMKEAIGPYLEAALAEGKVSKTE